MKKFSLIGILTVIVIYVLCLIFNWNATIVMLGCIVVTGAFFFLSDGSSIHTAKLNNYSYLDLHSGQLEYAHNSRLNSAKNNSPITITLVAIALTAVLCIAHFNVFIKNKDKLTYDPCNYVIHILDNSEINIALDGDNVTYLYILSNSEHDIYQELKGVYADDTRYDSILPIVYQYDSSSDRYRHQIIINFYMDEFDYDDASTLFEFLGIKDLMKDKCLTYTELLQSKTFKFKDVLTLGTFIDNRKEGESNK